MASLITDDFKGQLTPAVTQSIILNRSADISPIFSALEAASAFEDVTQAEFNWYEDELPTSRSQINNGPDNYNAATTSLVVDSAAVFFTGAVVLAEATGEVMLVTGINTGTNTITVQRGLGVTTAAVASVADDAFLQVIGSAHPELSSSPDPRNTAPSKVTNFTQTFRESVELSDRMLSSATLTENEQARQRGKHLFVVQERIERSFLFGSGEPADGSQQLDGNGKRVTYTKGLLNAIETHVDNIGGAMNMAAWQAFAEKAFARGSKTKLLFAGNTLLSAINSLYRGQLRIENLASAVGLQVRRVLTDYGEFQVVQHQGLQGGYAGTGIVVDPTGAQIRYHQNRGRLRLEQNIQANDVDGQRDEWKGDLGLYWGAEQQHAVLKGVTAAA